MWPPILLLCLFAGTSWAFVPDNPDFRGIPSIVYPNDGFYLTRNAFAPSSDSAQQVVEKFLARMIRSLESKDVAITSGLFQPGFKIFQTLPEEIVGRLLEIPFGTKLTFTLKSVLDSRSKSRFTVDMSGFLPASVEANFVLNKLDQQLEIGEISSCSRGFIGFSQREDSNAVVRRFLEHVKQVFASRSPVRVGNLLDEKFVFKMCEPHPKSEVVEQIISFLSSGALIEFPLIESKWIDQGQIEYTAEVNVSMMDRFEAIFVYHPQRNVLISGRGYGCPSKRFSDF